MRIQPISYVFWCLPPVVMIAIAAYMQRGRLQRDFPVFFNYLVFQIAAFAVEFPLRHWGYFFWVDWVITALSVLFSFAVLVELVQKVADGTETLQHWNIPLLCWCAFAVMAVIGMWPFASDVDNLMNGIWVMRRAVRVAQFALAFFMVMFGAAVRISRRSLVFGIAVGFGLFAVVNLWVIALLSNRVIFSHATLRGVNGAADVISTFIWLAYAAAATKDVDPLRLS